MNNPNTLTRNQIIIDQFGTDTVFITCQDFSFAYTKPESILKPEVIDQYRYVGGLQSNFESDSKEALELEEKLCQIAEILLG